MRRQIPGFGPREGRALAVATLSVALLAMSVGARAQCDDRSGSGNEVVGTLLGAALGGLLGSQVGGGTGNKIAIGAGVLAGGLLGNKVGSAMDCEDQRYHEQTAQETLEHSRTGTTNTWQNPDSGHSGTVTPTRTFQRNDGQYCRDFRQTVEVDGRLVEESRTACRQDDGTWQVAGG